MKTLNLNGYAIVSIEPKDDTNDNTLIPEPSMVSLEGDLECVQTLTGELSVANIEAKRKLQRLGLNPLDYNIKIKLQGVESIDLKEGMFAKIPNKILSNSVLAIIKNAENPLHPRSQFLLELSEEDNKHWSYLLINNGAACLAGEEDIDYEREGIPFDTFMNELTRQKKL
jgi:hypothetical protein